MTENYSKELLAKNKKQAKVTALILAGVAILILVLFVINVAWK